MADIPINPVTRRVEFTGNTGTGPFAFTFNVLAQADIAAYKNNTLLALTSDYTVSLNSNGTGSITLTSALIATDELVIIGDLPLSRTTDFVTAGDLLASSLNEQFDSNVVMSQQLDERFDRTIRSQPGDINKNLYLPLVDDRVSQLLSFDSSGNITTTNLSNVPDIGTVNLTVSGLASFADGSLGAPSITNIGDTNTGIYFPAADQLAFTAGGNDIFSITSTYGLMSKPLYFSDGILLTDNSATALTIKEGSNNYLTFVTTNGSEKLSFGKPIDVTGAITTNTSLNIASSTTVDGILDEDNMASNSATKLATQQSIKAYVDAQVGTVDTLAEVLGNGNTTGSNNIIVTAGQSITVDTISETTAANGVVIDGVTLKDGGATVTADVSFGDNDKAIFGAGSDLQIYHDGTRSYVDDIGAGSLWLRGGDVQIKSTASETMAEFSNNGAVTLYYDNAAKLATTSTGIDVTGTAKSTAVTTTNSGVTLQSSSVTKSAINVAATTNQGINGTAAGDQYNWTTGGKMLWSTDNGTNAHLVLDASGKVGIGISSGLTYPLTIKEDTDNSYIHFVNSTTGTAFSDGTQIGVPSGSTDLIINNRENANTKFYTANTERMRIDSSGNVGIGTTSPFDVFHVRVGTDKNLYFTDASSETGNVATIQGINNAGSSLASVGFRGTDIRFANQSSETMRIDNSGKVGIGTSSPTGKLSIASGTYNAATPLATADDIVISGNQSLGMSFITASAGSSNQTIVFGDSDNTDIGMIRYAHANNSMQFTTNTTEAMRIDSSGNLLVGTTDSTPIGSGGTAITPDGRIDISRDGGLAAQFERRTSDGNIVSFIKDGSTVGSIGTIGGFTVIGSGDTGILFDATEDAVKPRNSSTASRDAQIDLGGLDDRFKNLYLSATAYVGLSSVISAGDQGIQVDGGNGIIYIGRGSTDVRTHISFLNPNGEVGKITTTGSSTSYVTSSDYRLKENVVDLTSATTRLKQLEPKRFNFIADADTTVDGFLAHEVQDIVPEAVTGAKDAMRDEEYEVTPAVLDDNGNVTTEAVMDTRSVPDYQGIDQSKLVPLLVATIQELEARITALENA